MTASSTPAGFTTDRVRRFVVDAPILEGTPRRFVQGDDAADVPVAAAVLGVPGVAEVVVEGSAVTVLRRTDAEWERLEDRIAYAIQTALRPHGAAPATPDEGAAPLADDEIFDIAARILRRDINPAVRGHGGQIDLIDVQDGVVVVRMMGGCQGCGMANVTLRQGIEENFRRTIPGFRALQDITDHAAGTNPYF